MRKTQSHKDFSSVLRSAMAGNKIVIGRDGKHRDSTGKFIGNSFSNAIRTATGRLPLPADDDTDE